MYTKQPLFRFWRVALLIFASLLIVSCGDFGAPPAEREIPLTGQSNTYTLSEVEASGVSGTALFEENENGNAVVTLTLNGTPAGGVHPAHIHFNSVAMGGDIAISLNPVDGATGISRTVVTQTDAGSAISYSNLLDYDGYINVHLSPEDLPTIVAQGDIGSNVLTGNRKTYPLNESDVQGISGEIVFEERVNGFALATITLAGTPDGGTHPAHIHENSAAMGGDIVFTFTPVDGSTGMSMSDTREGGMDGEPSLTFADILAIDGYVNVHLSPEELSTIVAQGDIGSNELTGETKVYPLIEADVDGISGEITFAERRNGYALATINLTGTPDGGMHPAHIHENSAAVSGGIIFTFTPVNGTTGMSQSDSREGGMDGEPSLSYEDILAIDGYVNVHLSADELGTIVAQGDIGANELTGVSITYPLNTADVPGISGNIIFEERINGFALATIQLDGTPDGGTHPAHIHENSAEEGGGILFTFTPVNGTSGMSHSDTREGGMDGEPTLTYADILPIDGYVNVHLSPDDLATIVAQGNIGANF